MVVTGVEEAVVVPEDVRDMDAVDERVVVALEVPVLVGDVVVVTVEVAVVDCVEKPDATTVDVAVEVADHATELVADVVAVDVCDVLRHM